MFENLISWSSVIAIAISLLLTINFLSIQCADNNCCNNHVIEDGCYVTVHALAEESKLNLKKWSWALFFILLVSFPYSPNFFANFLLAFSFLAMVISGVVAVNKIYTLGVNSYCAIFYVPATVLTAVLTKDAVLHAFYDNSIFCGFYNQFRMLGSLNSSSMYWRALYELLQEFTAYIGMSLLFICLINSCFGFIKGRRFGGTIIAISFWIMVTVIAHFLASGYIAKISGGEWMCVINEYKTMFNGFSFFDL